MNGIVIRSTAVEAVAVISNRVAVGKPGDAHLIGGRIIFAHAYLIVSGKKMIAPDKKLREEITD